MATSLHNPSSKPPGNLPDASQLRIGIVVAEWNANITRKLLTAACRTLKTAGVKKHNILIRHVPGSFELTYGARKLAASEHPDAVIVLGCIIRGDTPHFHYVSSGVTQGITALNLTGDIPFIFGLLTTDTLQQALDRAGGKYGNKGHEAALAALQMALLS